MQVSSDAIKAASAAASKLPSDVFVYNGRLQPVTDLDCVKKVSAAKARPKATLFLTTHGGDPDAAYKLARHFQEKYEHFTVVISGRCKSAGTLVAIGAHELAFTPYGELGPLDIQLSKVDKFDHLESGLTIQDSLDTLQARAVREYMNMVQAYIRANNGLLSFAAATDAASKFITGLYAPIFARIDPEEVGARARSMRIAIDYGKRLDARTQNLQKDTLKTLAETYPSHSFVIDQQEASLLFKQVRSVTDHEMAVVEALGNHARFEMSSGTDVPFHVLSDKENAIVVETKETSDEAKSERGSSPAHDQDSTGAVRKAVATRKRSKRGRDAGTLEHALGSGINGTSEAV